MLDIKYIRENLDEIKENNLKRGVKVDLEKLLVLDEKKREIIGKAEKLRAERNKNSKGKPSEEDITRLRKVGDEIFGLESELEKTDKDFNFLLSQVPNLTHPDVPVGGEESFKVLEMIGEPPILDFKPKEHEAIFNDLDLIDFERGAKVTGAKFYFVKNGLVRLNQALINYGMDVVSKHGYVLMETPDLAKNEVIEGIGFKPRGPESQVYPVENTDLSLIATAEITVGGYHADEVLNLSKGPKKYVALSHCFRTEAGTYGRESKGLYRVHQFTKLEMFVFCLPQDSEKMHEELLSIEKEIADGLEIPYRVIDVASGDLGAPAYRKYDIEAWMVMKNDYGEITSTSNCTDYQSRRLNIRYKKENGETDFVHTLNGTAVVTSRFPVAIAENCQTKNGTVKIPKALQNYMGGVKEIK
jgi:seryl-tRNA synthetase